MTKKWMTFLLTGVAAASLAACGSQETASSQGTSLSTPAANQQEPAAKPSLPSVFQTSVFLGDSITEGLSFHDVLDEANVAAGAGKTAEFALEDIDDLVKRNPEHIYIQLGSDDILWPVENPVAYALDQYAKLIGQIKEKLPNAKISILTVTPVTAEAEKKEPRYKTIGEYNQGLKELAAKEQVEYIDLSPLFTGRSDLHDADGIHFKAEFYPLMLEFIKNRQK
ncbi:SGNH/GDSL hydrolase family protein [Brevibacillus borstelensis]|uniref:SGNH/GDSL hydrolase family protein n=1 Tax=Brevibacillus borstelensis TaxID=45462 RepID=UPI002E1E68CA|nr:SGNH/GDSL hydrolase family protein [Brevibacillus borstelensis]